MKRAASPNEPIPLAKRVHVGPNDSLHWHGARPLNFDSSLYDELVLFIFSHLSWVDLCAIQRTNQHWSRLAADNQVCIRVVFDLLLFKRSYLLLRCDRSCGRICIFESMVVRDYGVRAGFLWLEKTVGKSNLYHLERTQRMSRIGNECLE